MDWLNIIFALFVTGYETSLLISLMNSFFKQKYRYQYILLSMLILQLVQMILFSQTSISVILTFLIDLGLISLSYAGKFSKKCALILAYYAVFSISDLLTKIILDWRQLFHLEGNEYVIIAVVISHLFSTGFICMIKRLGIDNRFEGYVWLTFIPIPLWATIQFIVIFPHATSLNGFYAGMFLTTCLSFLAMLMYALSYKNKKILQNQYEYKLKMMKLYRKILLEYFDEIKTGSAGLEKFAHDSIHYISLLVNMYESPSRYSKEAADDFGNYISENFLKYQFIFYTGNYDIDAILNSVYSTMEEKKISLIISGQLPPLIEWLDPAYICVILGNSLQTAVHMIENFKASKIIDINFKAGESLNWILFKMEIPLGKAEIEDMLQGKNKEVSLSLKNIQDIAEDNDGFLKVYGQNDKFILTILLQNIKNGGTNEQDK